MEVVAGASPKEAGAIKEWLAGFTIENIDSNIAERAATIRREKKIRLPDAIIWATAQVNALF